MKRIATALMLICVSASAADNLKFHGTLVAPPTCTISNGNTIEVDFSKVFIDRIDGKTLCRTCRIPLPVARPPEIRRWR